MGLLDWFKPKRDPPKKSKPKATPSTIPTESPRPSKLPKTTAKWKDRKTNNFADCLELLSDIVHESPRD